MLRRIAENIRTFCPRSPARDGGYLSIQYSHPLWLCEYLLTRKGYDFAEAFLQSNNEPPPLCIQVNTLKVSAADYMRALTGAEIPLSRLEPEGCLALEGGLATELPGFEEGLFYVQDRAARLAVEIAAPEPGMRVLDACSCPGGKSFAAAIAMENCGSILSCDIHEKKLRVLEAGRSGSGSASSRPGAMDARALTRRLERALTL